MWLTRLSGSLAYHTRYMLLGMSPQRQLTLNIAMDDGQGVKNNVVVLPLGYEDQPLTASHFNCSHIIRRGPD
jgi:hypothetical protein